MNQAVDGAVYSTRRVSSGIEGLDHVLNGGFPQGRITLLEGAPGTGKTTVALHFLIAAARRGERCLFMSIAQSHEEIGMIAASHGMSLDGVEIRSPELIEGDDAISVESDEASLRQLLAATYEGLEEVKPAVFVFDSLLELRLLSGGVLAYRSRLTQLRRHLRDARTTSLLLDHVGDEGYRLERGIVHGVLGLEAISPSIGTSRRRLHVIKMRGAEFVEGFHDFRIRQGGVTVYPRVVPPAIGDGSVRSQLEVPQETLNRMLGGGLEFGTTTLISGQSGSGKSTTSTVFVDAGARQGIKSALFLFEERPEVFRERSESIGFPLRSYEAAGLVTLRHFYPAEISPGEFSRNVIAAVEDGARIVVVDSLSGYLNALLEREQVVTHLHTLLQFLSRCGCLVIVTTAQKGLLGEPPQSDVDTSYLADSVILLRQYAAGSIIRRSIAILKKRHSQHERGIQELVIAPGSVDITDLSDEQADRAGAAPKMSGD